MRRKLREAAAAGEFHRVNFALLYWVHASV